METKNGRAVLSRRRARGRHKLTVSDERAVRTSSIKSPPAAASFPRSSRILRSADFRTVYDNGIRVSGPLFAAFCLAREETDGGEGARLGLTVPRAIGGAVVRNRIKRRLREAFRLHRAEFGSQWDIVLNPRRAALAAPFPEIERAFAKVIEKCAHLMIWRILRIYKRWISPLLPSACRFHPTCSEYMMQAVEKHGVRRGVWMGLLPHRQVPSVS